MRNRFIRACLIRALRTVCQALASMLPVGTVVTPSLLQSMDWSFLFVILAWLGTGALAGVAAFLTSIATGLPEVDLETALYMNQDEPEDSEVQDEE